MSSTIQLPEDKLIELLLELKVSNGSWSRAIIAEWSQRTTPDQAKAILNSQPQIAYALVALMVKIGIIDIPIFQVSLTLSYIRPVSDHSFPANLGYVRSSAKRASSHHDVSCPPSSPGSQFAQRNTTIHDTPTRGLPHRCTTSRSKWISTILQWRTCRNLGAYGPLQCTSTSANCEPEHRGNASRHTRKPTGKSHKLMRSIDCTSLNTVSRKLF
jgi:hypothetical protein